MAAFGKFRSGSTARTQAARGRQGPTGSFDLRELVERRPVFFATLMLSALAIYWPGRQIVADRNLPLPRDLQPGMSVAAWPYEAPSGCPLHTWHVGEFLPFECMRGKVISGGEPIGLEPVKNISWYFGRSRRMPNYLQRHWVRAGDDALLVAGPEFAAGRILAVATQRFHADKPPQGPHSGGDYSRTPDDYVAGVRSGLWTNTWFTLTALAVFWVWGLAKLLIGSDDTEGRFD